MCFLEDICLRFQRAANGNLLLLIYPFFLHLAQSIRSVTRPGCDVIYKGVNAQKRDHMT